jgi:sugar phosphate isomerase/epimerase
MRDLTRGADHLSINTATLKNLTLRQAIEACARHGIRGIAPWRDRLQECGVTEAALLLRDHGMAVSGLCRGGMFAAPDWLDDNRRALDEAATIGARCLVLVVGGLLPGSRDLGAARALVADRIAALLPHAKESGVKLAIEPLHPIYAADRACVNTLAHALDLCDALGPGIGVAVDVYHVWWDPDLERQIHRAGKERLLAFHLCDWLVPTTDLLLDRGMMGDGVVDIPKIRSWVEAAGFADLCEVEIFSAANWWKRAPDEVLRTCIERYNTVC